ncbi:MAG TPA: TlpA disulfide reductase family protein, partial [Terriglobales bacterium]|nr:TlpA disulfide reductase family protein [Terriglobales bacterium]
MHSDPLTNNDRPSADQPVTPGADLPSAAPPAPEGPRRSSARDAVVLSVIVIVIAVMIWSAVRVSQRRGPQPAVTPGATLIGKTAPNFQLTTLDGKQVSLTDFRGKAVLLNFWATWCGPCRIEMPWFVDLQKKYAPQGFEIVGVAMDDSGEKAIKEFTQQVGTNYTILLGKDAIGDAYGVEGMPTSFFIARDGKIIDQTLGLASKKELEDRIERALASGPQSSMAGAPASPWAAVVSS